MTRLTPLILVFLILGCRPNGEVVRYMGRPPVSIRTAPVDGTYLLYPGTDDPAILIEDLKAGDKIGFAYQQTSAGKRLYAVAGQDQSFNLERGERYAWMLQSKMTGAKRLGGTEGASASQQRHQAAQRAFEAAEQQLKTAQDNYESAKRRLEQAK